MRYPSRPTLRRPLLVGLVAASTAVSVAGPAASAPPASRPRAVAVDIATAQRTLDALGLKISAAAESYDQAKIALDSARTRAGAARARASAAGTIYTTKRAVLARYAAAAYRSGGVGGLTVAVATGSPADYLDRLSLLDVAAHRQAEVVADVDAARRSAEASAATAVAVERASAAAFVRIAAAKSSVQAQVAAQQALIARLRAEQRRLDRAAAAAAASAPSVSVAATAAAERLSTVLGTPAKAAATTHVSATYNRPRPKPPTPPAPPAPPASTRGAIAVRAAYGALGRPYVWGASGPGSFDCSGLTSWAWRAAGVSLPHSSAAQYGSGPHVSTSSLRAGDLLFFYSPIHHVGIYVGGGKMIDAPHTGTVVSVRTVIWSNYVGAVRPG